MSSVFLSYAHVDEAVARRIAARLRAAGYDVWWDDQIPAHRPYAEVIDQRLREASCAIAIWSAAAVKSQWVRAEADIARADNKLIQITIDASVPPLPFDQLQRTDLSGWKGSERHAGWRKVLAAVGELTSGAPDHAVESSAARAPVRVARPALLAVALLALGGALAWAAWSFWPKSESGVLRVAVAPFESADPGLKATASGVSDTLVADLGQMLTPPVSGEAALAAGHGGARLLVHGAVARDGSDVTARVRVDDTRTGQTLWSAEMRRDAREAAALPDQVAARLTQMLAHTRRDFGSDGNGADSAVLADYIRIMDDVTLGIDHSATILQSDRDLVAHAPKLSHSHSNLANDLALAARSQSGAVANAWRAGARAEALKALQINPRDGDAYIALQLLESPRAYVRREAILQEAITKLPPDAWLLTWAGYTQRGVGRTQAGDDFHRQAMGLDPFYPETLADNIHVLFTEGRIADAEALAVKSQRMWPGNPVIRRAVLAEALFYAAPDRALATIADLHDGEESLDPAAAQAWRAFIEDRKSGAWRPQTAQALTAVADAGLTSGPMAVSALAQMGRIDEAFALASRLLDRTGRLDPTPLFEPAAAALREDRRFVPLMARVQVVDYWLKTGRYADFCAEPGLPYDCKAEAAKAVSKP